MKHLLALGPLLLAGCMIHDYGDEAPRRPVRRVEPAPTPAPRRVAVREYRDHGPSCGDLEAAAGLSSDRKRAEALEKLADRKGLSAHEQVHLVDLAVDAIESDRQKADVLERLAKARDLHPDARLHLARRLKEIPGDTDKVMEALLKNPPRGERPEPREVVPPPLPTPDPGPEPGAVPVLGLRVSAEGAAVVTHVDPKGPAGVAGLLSGDRLLSINDWEVADLSSLLNGLKAELEVKKAAELWMKVERKGRKLAFAVDAPKRD